MKNKPNLLNFKYNKKWAMDIVNKVEELCDIINKYFPKIHVTHIDLHSNKKLNKDGDVLQQCVTSYGLVSFRNDKDIYPHLYSSKKSINKTIKKK